jgi:hypothetical protein
VTTGICTGGRRWWLISGWSFLPIWFKRRTRSWS